MLKRAEEIDVAEDGLYGEDKRGDELPKELRFRQGRLKRIREADLAALSEVVPVGVARDLHAVLHEGGRDVVGSV